MPVTKENVIRFNHAIDAERKIRGDAQDNIEKMYRERLSWLTAQLESAEELTRRLTESNTALAERVQELTNECKGFRERWDSAEKYIVEKNLTMEYAKWAEENVIPW
jgi:predicted transcriptional regulator